MCPAQSRISYLGRDVKMALFKARRDLYLLGARLTGKKEARSLFGEIYDKNLFGDPESKSGRGSSIEATETIRRELPGLIGRYEIRSILDIPCGDFNWMQAVDIGHVDYTGADIVEPMVLRNTARFAAMNRRFVVLDARADRLPPVDLILCRDLFMHLPNADISAVLQNFKASGARYLCSTNFREARKNPDTYTGGFRPFNLQLGPFFLPTALETIDDFDFSRRWGRSMSLWRIADLQDLAIRRRDT